MPPKKQDQQELVSGKPLTRIALADKPPALGGVITYHTPEEISRLFGFEYTESLWGQQKELTKYLEDKALHKRIVNRPDQPKEQAILHRLANPLASLAICKISEEKGIGHGLFALEDIPEGTILFLYSGEVTSSEVVDEGDGYAYLWANIGQSQSEKCVSALHKGNLSRFMQHLPVDGERHKGFLKKSLAKIYSPALLAAKNIKLDDFVEEMYRPYRDLELDQIHFKDKDSQNKLASDNVKVSQAVVNNVPVVVCSALYPIKKHEILGFSYGKNYWLSAGVQPRYFSQDGGVIPQTAYTVAPSAVIKPLASTPEVPLAIVPAITKNKQYCFFKLAPSQSSYIQSLQQVVGKKEISIQHAESSPPTAYLLLSWLKQLPAAALDELAFGAHDPEGGERSGLGISRTFLEDVRNGLR